jgi:hypothetical protein
MVGTPTFIGIVMGINRCKPSVASGRSGRPRPGAFSLRAQGRKIAIYSVFFNFQ